MGFKEKNDTHWPLPTLQASSVKHAAVRCASHWLKPAAVGTRGRSMCRWRVEVPWKNMHHYPTVFAGWSQKDHPILTQIDISDISYNSWLSSMKIPHFSWLRPNISPWSRIPYCIYMYIYIYPGYIPIIFALCPLYLNGWWNHYYNPIAAFLGNSLITSDPYKIS